MRILGLLVFSVAMLVPPKAAGPLLAEHYYDYSRCTDWEVPMRNGLRCTMWAIYLDEWQRRKASVSEQPSANRDLSVPK
jgi:hypothetical protein